MPGEALLRGQQAARQIVPRSILRRRLKWAILWVGTGGSLSRERVSLPINGYASPAVQDVAPAPVSCGPSIVPVRRGDAPRRRVSAESGTEFGKVGGQRGA